MERKTKIILWSTLAVITLGGIIIYSYRKSLGKNTLIQGIKSGAVKRSRRIKIKRT